MYGATDETYTVRKGAPPEVVVRQHMLGKAWMEEQKASPNIRSLPVYTILLIFSQQLLNL